MGRGQALKRRPLGWEGSLPPIKLEENWGNLAPCSLTTERSDGCRAHSKGGCRDGGNSIAQQKRAGPGSIAHPDPTQPSHREGWGGVFFFPTVRNWANLLFVSHMGSQMDGEEGVG